MLTKPRIMQNIIVKSNFKRLNYNVSALRRTRRSEYDIWRKLLNRLVNLHCTHSILFIRYAYLGLGDHTGESYSSNGLTSQAAQ